MPTGHTELLTYVEFGSLHATTQLVSSLCLHALLKPIVTPAVLHCLSKLVHVPLAHASPSDPQLVPSFAVLSSGHSAEVPVQYSG